MVSVVDFIPTGLSISKKGCRCSVMDVDSIIKEDLNRVEKPHCYLSWEESALQTQGPLEKLGWSSIWVLKSRSKCGQCW